MGEKLSMNTLVSVSAINATTKDTTAELKRVAAKVVVSSTAAEFTLQGITAVVNTPKHSSV